MEVGSYLSELECHKAFIYISVNIIILSVRLIIMTL